MRCRMKGSGAINAGKPNRLETTMTPKPILPLCVCGDGACQIPYGTCHCRCGGVTSVFRYSARVRREGKPHAFLHGHRRNMLPKSSSSEVYLDGASGRQYCLIPLTRGLFARVDPFSFGWFSCWPWHASAGGYAVRNRRKADGPGSALIYMHRVVSGANDSVGDHIDRNTLNNCRYNLRNATAQQNSANRKMKKPNTSGFKGVGWNKEIRKWFGLLTCRGKYYYVGSFTNPVDAAKAYDAKAVEINGAFAYLNFPIERT
jgi:hypothetical protein